jgi:type IV fimbrial biogenesis protein FimT
MNAQRTPPLPLSGRARAARARAGVTLLELAIVLAVLAVLGALAVPTLGARLERQRLSAAAQALAADLANARFEAAQRGQALHVQPSAGAPWCWAVGTQAACDCAQPQPCHLHRVPDTAHPGVRLVQASAVRLEPGGAAGTLAQVATFESRRGEQLRVLLLPMGRARICASAGTLAEYAPC